MCKRKQSCAGNNIPDEYRIRNQRDVQGKPAACLQNELDRTDAVFSMVASNEDIVHYKQMLFNEYFLLKTTEYYSLL